jgi:hypothetical protein
LPAKTPTQKERSSKTGMKNMKKMNVVEREG